MHLAFSLINIIKTQYSIGFFVATTDLYFVDNGPLEMTNGTGTHTKV